MKPKTPYAVACAALLAIHAAQAETIALITDFTDPASGAIADTLELLQSAGHTVTVVGTGTVNGSLTTAYNGGPQTKAQFLETFDVVLISRTCGSANFTDAAGWSALNTGIVNANAYAARAGDRLGWFGAAQLNAAANNPDTTIVDAAHPIFEGVTITDGSANLFTDPFIGEQWSSMQGSIGTGTVLARAVSNAEAIPIAVWNPGNTFANGIVVPKRRVFFSLTGYNNPAATQLANTNGLTAAGDAAFLNAITWAAFDEQIPDSDNDGLPDAWEEANFGDITLYDGDDDPDGDGFKNIEEYEAGSNPNNADSVPGDIDGDGLLDEDEIAFFGNLNQGPDGDFDGDHTSNIDEMNGGTSPANANDWPDIDDDGMADGWELANGLVVGTDDSGADPDGDDFSNLQEFLAGTDPHDPDWFPGHAILAHRWSFNGDLVDSVGGSDAQILNDDPLSLGFSSVQSDTDVELFGGTKTASDYILLGNNLLSDLQEDGVKPVTIELWATQNFVSNWSRIWDFGRDVNGDPGAQGSLRMTWSTGTDVNTDQVEWAGAAGVWNTNAPYVPTAPYHIVMTIVPAVYSNGAINVGSQVTWYSAPASSSQDGGHPLFTAKGTFNTALDLRGLIDTVGYLGRSMWPDAIAAATYDEVRIWKGALSKTERELFQLLGPDNIDRADADDDGFPDQWELVHFGNTTTAAAGADADGDGETDDAELLAESDPTNDLSVSTDRDGDGLPDDWELQYFNNLLQTPFDDPDLDFSDNAEELAFGTDPSDPTSSPDTDGDGIPDGWEFEWFNDLTTADSTQRPGGTDTNFDGDFDTDLEEFLAGTDPLDEFSGRDEDDDGLPDFWEWTYFQSLGDPGYLQYNGTHDPDGDGASNAVEFAAGTDPNNPDDFPDVNDDGIPDGILLAATDGFGASSFNSGLNWTGGIAPAPGTNNTVIGFTLRTPDVDAANTTFAGDLLVISNSGSIWGKGTNSIASADYVLHFGTIRNAVSAPGPITFGGTIEVLDDSTLWADNGPLIITADVSGSAALTLTGNAAAINPVQFDSSGNTWTGDLFQGPRASLIVNGTLATGSGSVHTIAPQGPGVSNTIGGTGTLDLAGTLEFDLSQTTPADGATWNILTTSNLNFGAGFTVTGAGFTSDGGAVGTRIWTSGDGDYVFDEMTGVLSFVGEVVGYDAWAATAGLTPGANDGALDNPDSDGYPNLLEYQLGGDPLAAEAALVTTTRDATHLVFTFERRDLSEADSSLTFRWSTALSTWNEVAVGATSSGPDANGVTVTVTEDGGSSADFDLIEIRVPLTNAVNGRLFGQLRGSQP